MTKNNSFVTLSAMGDTEYTANELTNFDASFIEKAEIVLTNSKGEKVSFELDEVSIKAEEIEDDRAEFNRIIEKLADENDEAFKALVDK